MSTKYQSYIEPDNGSNAVYGARWFCETFTLTAAQAHTITSVKLKINKLGSPGTFDIAIRAVDGAHKPILPNLCIGSVAEADIPAGRTWYEITLGAGAALDASTEYAIVMSAPSGDNDDNEVQFSIDTGSGYAEGAFEMSSDSGSSWTVFVDEGDILFEEWGDPPIGVADMTLLQVDGAVGDWYGFGHASQFDAVCVNVGDVGADITLDTFEYSQGGGSWGTLVVLYNSLNNWATAGKVWLAFERPGDWAVDTIAGIANQYWIKLKASATGAGYTQPKGIQAWILVY